jgi:hypothetical protein
MQGWGVQVQLLQLVLGVKKGEIVSKKHCQVWLPTHLIISWIKVQVQPLQLALGESKVLKVLPKLGLNGSTVVEYSTHHPKVEGSSPDAAAVTRTK